MDYNNHSQLYPGLTFTPPPMNGCYSPIWKPRQSRWTTPGSQDRYSYSREFLRMDIPALFQLQFDRLFQLHLNRGLTALPLPFTPDMYTPLTSTSSLSKFNGPFLQENPSCLSQQPIVSTMPCEAFRCSGDRHGRRRHRHYSRSFENPPIFFPSQPFTESSIFKGPGNYNVQNDCPNLSHSYIPLPRRQSSASSYSFHPSNNVFPLHDLANPPRTPAKVDVDGIDFTNRANRIPASASQSLPQPAWIPGQEETYPFASYGQHMTGFHDLHLRAPGARIVIDGVDYIDRLEGISMGVTQRMNTDTDVHHHLDRPRNVLNTMEPQ